MKIELFVNGREVRREALGRYVVDSPIVGKTVAAILKRQKETQKAKNVSTNNIK